MLTFIIFTLQERNLNFSILPYTFLDKPRNIVAQMIIDEVKSNFPKVSEDHIIRKSLKERNLNFSILPYTFLDKPDRNIAQMIIDEVKSNFPKTEDHIYTKLTMFFTNAVNKPPPIEILSNKVEITTLKI